MKKLPEFIALTVGLGMLSLVGAVAWRTVDADALAAPKEPSTKRVMVLSTAR